MKKETINFEHGQIEILKNGNLIYFTVYGEYTEDDAIVMTKYSENFFNEINGPVIRIWDFRNIEATDFQLSPQFINRLRDWATQIIKKWPDSVAYFIGDKPFIYGMSRMYELKTANDHISLTVLKSFDELPDILKSRISKK